MLEASLYQKVTEAIDHQRVGLGNNCFHDFVLLIRSSDLELLLQKDGSLLVVVANDLVNDVLPVAVDIAIKQTAIVQRLRSGQVGLALRGRRL